MLRFSKGMCNVSFVREDVWLLASGIAQEASYELETTSLGVSEFSFPCMLSALSFKYLESVIRVDGKI